MVEGLSGLASAWSLRQALNTVDKNRFIRRIVPILLGVANQPSNEAGADSERYLSFQEFLDSFESRMPGLAK